MIEIKGKYNTAIVYTDEVESSAESRLKTFCDQEFLAGSKIRVMPDVHDGKGCTIGTTMTIQNAVIPNAVGVDIGCFTGDTMIPLSNGQPDVALQDVVDQDIWVYSINSDNQIIPAKARCMKTRSNATLVAVTLDNGEVIRCTPDHKFMLKDGSYKEAKDLEPNESLRPFNYKINQDGHIYVIQSRGVNPKQYTFHRFIMHHVLHKNIDGLVVHHKDGNGLNNIPDNLEIMTFSDHSKHHREVEDVHVFQTEEFKSKRLEKLRENNFYTEKYYEQRAKIGTANFKKYMEQNPEHFSKVVEQNAKRLGEISKRHAASHYWNVYSYLKKLYKYAIQIYPNDITKESWELIRSKTARYGQPRYEAALNYINRINMTWDDLLNQDCWDDKINENHKVVSVVPLDYTEDVYCLNVPVHHNFALSSGVFVHNCAILTVKLKERYIDLQHLDKFINQNIPHGKAVRKRPHRGHGRIDVTKLNCYKYMRKRRILESLGTVGAGNHYIELNKNSEGEFYLQVHTGSRNPGLQVANIYQKMANTDCKRRGIDIKYDLAYLTGEHMEDYIHDMKIMQEFAALNRRIIADDIIEGLSLKEVERFDTVHNYIDTDNMILRKGACAAYEGQKLIIPMNMKDGSFICKGKGNPEWNYSAPHGAGRLMSRTQAKNTLTMEDYKESMKGIYSTSVSAHTIDEAPMAYKPVESIISQISDTVDVLEHIKPVYNFKSQEW